MFKNKNSHAVSPPNAVFPRPFVKTHTTAYIITTKHYLCKMKVKELKNLTYEQNKKYRFAIRSGYFEDWEQNPRGWKHSFVGAFIWKYPKRVRTLNILKDILGTNPTWEDLTDDTLRDLVDEMTTQQLTTSSIRTMCAELKTVLNANRRRVPSQEFHTILSAKKTVSQSAYLTAAEMQLFLSYKPRTEIERFVYRNFCVGMMTGARLVDAVRLTVSNCDIETNMLSYVPQKTPGIIVRVPVDERHNLRTFLASTCKKEPCLDTFNATLRNICYRVGIKDVCTVVRAGKNITGPKYELVSSHTARRTFATNLYLAGVALEDIALMMGHGKNIETTKRYICAERSISPNVMMYFQEPAARSEEELDAYEDAFLYEKHRQLSI